MLPELLATYRLPLRSAAICSGEARPVSDPLILRAGVEALPRVKVEMAPAAGAVLRDDDGCLSTGDGGSGAGGQGGCDDGRESPERAVRGM